MDKGLIESIGPTGFSKSTSDSANNHSFLSKNLLYQTSFFLLLATFIFLNIYIFSTFKALILLDFNLVFLLFSFYIFFCIIGLIYLSLV